MHYPCAALVRRWHESTGVLIATHLTTRRARVCVWTDLCEAGDVFEEFRRLIQRTQYEFLTVPHVRIQNRSTARRALLERLSSYERRVEAREEAAKLVGQQTETGGAARQRGGGRGIHIGRRVLTEERRNDEA
jgi:hypothetical protein